MRKILYCLLALLVISLENRAQTVSVSNDVEALSPGDTLSLFLHINGVEMMTSTHFEVITPDRFSVAEVTTTMDWSAMFSEEKGVMGAISTTDHALTGEGDIAVIKMAVAEGTAEGSYPVTISNFRVNGKTLDITAESEVRVTNEVTAIQSPKVQGLMPTERIYNIGGLPTTATSKGIYIKKGRKLLIK